MLVFVLLCGLIAQVPATPPAAVELRVKNSEELLTALRSATAGARILVERGDYQACSASNVRGSSKAPIVIRAADPTKPPVFRHGLMLSDVEHLEIESLSIIGSPTNGLNIDDGGSFDTPSHHVVLRGLVVRDCGARANHDGIKLSGVDDFRLEGCTIERWGRGGSAIDMVGCHRGLIEACAIRDLESGAASSGVQAKGGSSDIVIRASRFEHAGERAINLGGSTGMDYFRPKPQGFEARNLTVEGCTFIGSLSPIAFVGVDGATVRFNTFYQPRKWVARILQETRAEGFVPCRKGSFSDNLIAYRASEVSVTVNVGPDTAPQSFEFARNYWYCIDDEQRAPPKLPVAEVDARGGADPKFADAPAGEFTLAADSPARAHGATALPPTKR